MAVRKRKIAVCVVLFVLLLAGLVTTAYTVLRRSVKNIIIQSVDELAEHDMRNIREYISGQLEDMKGLCRELEIENPSELSELQDTLNVKSLAGRFNKVYLIDEDGNLYANTYTVFDKSENYFLSYFNGDNGDEFVRRYDDKEEYHEFKREYLLYGVRFADEPLELAGIRFVAIAALNDISEIQDKMRISSFDGKGYSSIINGDGYYIVNVNRTSSLNQVPNFFDMLQGAKISGYSVEEIQEVIRNREALEFYYTNDDGVKKYVLLKPIEDSYWYFVDSVEASVFTEQTYTFMFITMSIVVGLILIFVLVLVSFYFMRRNLKKMYTSTTEGVYNRRYYDDKLADKRVTALVIADLDHLKHINDNYGHLAGDQAIARTAEVLLMNIGSLGDVVRYGGDEFVIAFKTQVEESDFQKYLDQILCDIRESRLEKYPEVQLTLSIGGCWQKGLTKVLFKQTDNLLYKAKKQRNCVVTNIEEK